MAILNSYVKLPEGRGNSKMIEAMKNILKHWRMDYCLVVFRPTPLKIMDFVSWDDDIPNIWKNKIHVPKHQPDYG